MKNILIGSLVILTLFLLGCEKQVGFTPELICEITPNPVEAGKEVVFTIDGKADCFTIYTGDTLHKYANSYTVAREGNKIDKEDTYLTLDSLNAIISSGNYPTSLTDKLATIVGEVYTSQVQAQTTMNMLLADTASYTNYELDDWTTELMAYLETDWGLLEPQEGWSTGESIDIAEMSYSYTYSESGTYTLTIIATTIGEKKYDGSGYKDEREYSADEYPINRLVKEFIITVN